MEWESLKDELEFDLKHLRQKRDNMGSAYAKEKITMMDHHVNDKERLTVLSYESSNAIKVALYSSLKSIT